MIARTSSCRTTSRSVKYTVAIPGTAFNACNASTTPERLFAGFHGWPRQDNAPYLLLFERCHRHCYGEISLARARRPDSKNYVVLLNCLNVRALIRAARYNRRLARRRCDFCRNNVAEICLVVFAHGFKGLIKFVFMNVHALLAR